MNQREPIALDTRNPDHLALLLDVATDAARQAGALIKKGITDDLHVSFKDEGKHNLVTIMDTASEALIKKVVGERLEGMLFLAEESGGNHDLTPMTWVVDPIDGTVNYAHGIPIYCVSIAVVADNEPVVGVIYAPETDELFTATRGGGAFLNGRRLRVSGTDDIDKAILVTGFPYNVAENPYGCIDAFSAFLGLGIPIRRLGSAALDLAYVAAGRFDGFWEVSLNEWDVAAGALMVVEAGGRMGTFAPDTPDRTLTIDRMLATNGRVHDAMLAVLRR